MTRADPPATCLAGNLAVRSWAPIRQTAYVSVRSPYGDRRAIPGQLTPPLPELAEAV